MTGEEHDVLIVGRYGVEHRVFSFDVEVCRRGSTSTGGLGAAFKSMDRLRLGLVKTALSA